MFKSYEISGLALSQRERGGIATLTRPNSKRLHGTGALGYAAGKRRGKTQIKKQNFTNQKGKNKNESTT